MPADAPHPQVRTARDVVVREVPSGVVLPLWHRILREGVPFDVARARLDAMSGAPGTRHLAAYDGDTVIGVVTTFPEDTTLAPGLRGEHFRGMAVDDAWRGTGVGTVLMRAVARLARGRGAEVLWANGRDSALGFYERIGFRVTGDGFVDDEMHLGHHVVIARVDQLALGPPVQPRAPRLLKTALHLLAGGIVAAGLMAAAIVLWTRNLIVFAAPLGVASLLAVWVAIDNQFVYPRQARTKDVGEQT